jgi:hypothetical protein
VQLNGGQDVKTSTRLFSEAQSREMWTPQTLLPPSPPIKRLELRARISARMRLVGTSASIAGK